ncbi:hypothetical protein GCM10010518_08880 [Kitasatospora cinereorecta]
MIERFLDAGHRIGWVTGDEVYGGNPKLRVALGKRGPGHVLAVASSAEVATGAGTLRADAPARRSRGRRCAGWLPAVDGPAVGGV